MNQVLSSGSSISAVSATAGEATNRRALTGSRRAYSALIGALFLLGFVFYGVGFGLVQSVTGAPDFLSTISAQQTTLFLGAFLMLLNSLADVGKGVLFFPILERRGKRTALAYLAAMIVEVVLLDVGVLCLLMLAPIAQQGINAGQAGADWANALGSLALQSNTISYQIAEMSLGLGGIFLWSLGTHIRLIPRILAIWGVIGYVILAAGAVAEIFGTHIGLVCSIPGGLFEVVLGFWLIFKGFQREAYGHGQARGAVMN
jgi:hypothetical protein